MRRIKMKKIVKKMVTLLTAMALVLGTVYTVAFADDNSPLSVSISPATKDDADQFDAKYASNNAVNQVAEFATLTTSTGNGNWVVSFPAGTPSGSVSLIAKNENTYTSYDITVTGPLASAESYTIGVGGGPNSVNWVKMGLYTVTQTYTVRFWDGDTLLKEQTGINYHGSATAPADPTKDGQIFTGWDKKFNDITGDLDVNATWAPAYYTVTFHSAYDSGDTILDTQDGIAYGGSATAPDEPEQDGYTFTGWDISFDNVTENLDVYATWDPIHYTVTFHSAYDSGDTILKTQDGILYGGSATAPDEPEQDGYTFAGWDISFDNITENVDVYATWDPIHYTVTFHSSYDSGDTILKTQDGILYGGSATAPADPTQDGYTFNGWDKSFNNITGNLDVYATWIPVQNVDYYTVRFHSAYNSGDTILKTQTGIISGGSATAPADPEQDGYTFNGWDRSFDNITGNLDVYATWTANIMPLDEPIFFPGAPQPIRPAIEATTPAVDNTEYANVPDETVAQGEPTIEDNTATDSITDEQVDLPQEDVAFGMPNTGEIVSMWLIGMVAAAAITGALVYISRRGKKRV